MSLLGGLAASAPAAGGYDMPEGYVAGSLDEPHQLRELRASGAAVLVTVEEGGAGAGVSCTDDLTVDGIAPDSAAQTAGVQLGMRLVQLQHGGEGEGWDAWQGKALSWDGVYDMIAGAPRPWRFTFAPPSALGDADSAPQPEPAPAPAPAPAPSPAPAEPAAAAAASRESRVAQLASQLNLSKDEQLATPTDDAFEALLKKIEEEVLPGEDLKESREGTFERLRKEWNTPPLGLLSAALPDGWAGEAVDAAAAKAAVGAESSAVEGEGAMDQLVEAARRVLFFPSRADMGHYPALLAVQPETRQLQVPFIAMFYLSHARRWATMEAFVSAGGMLTLAGLVLQDNVYMRSQALGCFECITSTEEFDWFASRPEGHPAYTAMRALADNKGFISAMCLVKPKEDFPGGTLLRLQTLAFWLSWLRLHYTEDNVLSVSQEVLDALAEWGGDSFAAKESRDEEQTFARKLHEDFSRFPVCDEILTGKHVGPSDGTLIETPTSKVKPEHSKESAGPTAEDLKTQGNTALKTGDTAGAIAKYTEAIAACEAEDSRSGGMGQSGANLLAVCLTNRGIARMSTKPKEGLQSQKPKPEDLKLATTDFEKAVAADSSYTKAHYRLATALFKQNKVEGALAALGPALAAEPDSKPITALRDKLVKLQQKGKGTSTISFSQKDRDREDPKKQREDREKAAAEKEAREKAAGLRKETISPGDGKTRPQPGDQLAMHYTGKLAAKWGGKQFDSSRERGEPFVFKIGTGQVIQGWDLGVAQMTLGERATLHIPAALGYGKAGAGSTIPPNADLVFDVELLAVGNQAMEQKAIQEVEAAKKREEKMEEKRREQRGGKKTDEEAAAAAEKIRLAREQETRKVEEEAEDELEAHSRRVQERRAADAKKAEEKAEAEAAKKAKREEEEKARRRARFEAKKKEKAAAEAKKQAEAEESGAAFTRVAIDEDDSDSDSDDGHKMAGSGARHGAAGGQMSPEGSSPTRRTGLGSLATKSSAAAAGGGKADELDTGGLPSATGDGFSGAKTVRQEAKKVAAVIPSLGVAAQTTSAAAPATAAQFEQRWRAARKDKAKEWAVLASVPPAQLPKIFRLNLATELMVEMVAAAGSASGETEAAAASLEALATVPRFSMVVAFMAKGEQETIRESFAALEAGGVSGERVATLKKAYCV